MIAVLSLLLVLVLSVLVTRVATVALTLTGLSREAARFQARSAFTGVGFTTSEAERVVNHPVRRRILMMLMITGNAGIVTVVSSLIITFVRTSNDDAWVPRIVLLVGGLVVLLWLAQSAWLDRRLSQWISSALQRFTELDTRDYASLLHLGGDYRIAELAVDSTDWLEGRTLRELQLNREGVLVLGVQKPGGMFRGAPRGDTQLAEGDTLLLYGRSDSFAELDDRRRGPGGEIAHGEAIAKQKQIEQEEEQD